MTTPERKEVITLIGSSRFKREFVAVAQKLMQENCERINTLSVFSKADGVVLSDAEINHLRVRIREYIASSTCVYVIDVDNYIGDDTRAELEYAMSLGKHIRYYSVEHGLTQPSASVQPVEPVRVVDVDIALRDAYDVKHRPEESKRDFLRRTMVTRNATVGAFGKTIAASLYSKEAYEAIRALPPEQQERMRQAVERIFQTAEQAVAPGAGNDTTATLKLHPIEYNFVEPQQSANLIKNTVRHETGRYIVGPGEIVSIPYDKATVKLITHTENGGKDITVGPAWASCWVEQSTAPLTRFLDQWKATIDAGYAVEYHDVAQLYPVSLNKHGDNSDHRMFTYRRHDGKLVVSGDDEKQTREAFDALNQSYVQVVLEDRLHKCEGPTWADPKKRALATIADVFTHWDGDPALAQALLRNLKEHLEGCEVEMLS